MKSFIVIARQNGGCDYTIGCGINYWIEEAESLSELKRGITNKLLGTSCNCEYSDDCDCDYEYDVDYEGNYSGRLNIDGWSELTYDKLTIMELGDGYYNFDLPKLAEQRKELIKQKKKKEKEDKEFKEYERLKAKFANEKKKSKPKEIPVLKLVCKSCSADFESKNKNIEFCSPCHEIEKRKLAEKMAEEARKQGIRSQLNSILRKDGWKDVRGVGFCKRTILLKYDKFSLWTQKEDGKYEWRRTNLDGVIDKIPSEAVELIKQHDFLIQEL